MAENDSRRVRKEFERLTSSGLRIVPVSRVAFSDAANLVKQHAYRLRAGDALHLAVAKEVGAQSMATLDTVMATNAERLLIRVEPL